MAIKLTNKANTAPVSATYPFGNIKDGVGATAGTAVNTVNHADFHQFFEKMMNHAGLTHNNLPDNQTNGFQLFEAYKTHIDQYFKGYFTANFGVLDNTKLYIAGIGAKGRTGGGGDYGIDIVSSGIAFYNNIPLYIDPTVTSFGFGISGQQPKIIKNGPIYMLSIASNVASGDLIPSVAFENLPNNIVDSDIRVKSWVTVSHNGTSGTCRYRYLDPKTVLFECILYNIPASTNPLLGVIPAPINEIYFFGIKTVSSVRSQQIGFINNTFGDVFLDGIPSSVYDFSLNIVYAID